MSVTKAAQYNLRPPATAGRSYSYKVQAQHGVASIEGNRSKVVEFHVPCSSNTFLDQSQSYLEFKLKARGGSGTTGLRLDSSAGSLLHRIEVYHGSNLLESIDGYNVLHSMMMDATVDNTTRNGVMSALMGTSVSPSAPGVATSATALTSTEYSTALGTTPPTEDASEFHSGLTLTASSAASVSADLTNIYRNQKLLKTYIDNNLVGGNTGRREGHNLFGSPGAAAGVTLQEVQAEDSTQIALPIALSGLLSPASKKYLPLFAMQADSLRIQITLEDPEKALVCTNGTTCKYVLEDMGYVCQFVELTSEVCGAILQDGLANGGGALKISSESFRGFESTLPTESTGFSIQVPARFSSLNSIYSCWRQTDNVSAISKKSITGRVQPQNLGYQYRIGSSLTPSQPVKSSPAALMEVLKTFNAVSASNFQSSITETNWDVLTDPSSAQTNDTGAFFVGLETSLFSNAADIVDSGKQTISEVVQLEGTCTKMSGTMTVNNFARFDMAVIVSDGLATTVF